MPVQTIQSVIAELNLIVEQCAANRNRAGYFAALYKRMTAAVAAAITGGGFEDGPRMERLDVVFARRYLNAYNAYHSRHPCSTSWKFAFDECSNNSLIVLQHILLGVNTHINLDLAIAAATVAPGNSIYAMEKDFHHINHLIGTLLDDVQECLSEVWPPLRVLTRVARGRQDVVLNFSVERARTTSWANAIVLANLQPSQQQAYVQTMDGLVRSVGVKIKSPGLGTGFFLRAIRATEYDDVARTIRLIDTTVVN